MKKLIDNLEEVYNLKNYENGEIDYIRILQNWMLHGYELSVGEFVYTDSDEIYNYFDKYARTYLEHGWQNDALNFGGTIEDVRRSRQDIAKRTWEQIKEEAEEE